MSEEDERLKSSLHSACQDSAKIHTLGGLHLGDTRFSDLFRGRILADWLVVTLLMEKTFSNYAGRLLPLDS